ncbi:MAG: hypothetical protein WCG98_01280 [bacterium]
MLAYNGTGDYFFSSDKQALAGYADKLIYLDDGDIVHLKGNDYSVKSNGIRADRKIEDMDLQLLESSK